MCPRPAPGTASWQNNSALLHRKPSFAHCHPQTSTCLHNQKTDHDSTGLQLPSILRPMPAQPRRCWYSSAGNSLRYSTDDVHQRYCTIQSDEDARKVPSLVLNSLVLHSIIPDVRCKPHQLLSSNHHRLFAYLHQISVPDLLL